MSVMDRRELLRLGASALAAATIPTTTTAQGGSTRVEPVAPTAKRIRIDAYSRTLHWLRTPEEVGDACRQIL
jgi:hypothetical protein